MTLKEAYDLLDSAVADDNPSKLNKFLTNAQAIKIVRDGIATLGQPKSKPLNLDENIDPLSEKRVWQVIKNQKRPIY